MPNAAFFLPLLLQSALIPFAVTLPLLAVSRALRLGGTGTAIASTAGFLCAYFAALHEQWSAIPKVALDWLPWLAVAATAGALLVERMHAPGLRLVARLILSLAIAGVVSWPALASFGLGKSCLVAGVAGVAITAVWSYLARISDSRPTPPLVLMVVAGAGALALMIDSSQAIGQLSGALAAVLAALVAFNVPRVRLAFSPAAIGVVVLVLGALLANAYIYADFPLGYIALLVSGLIVEPSLEALDQICRHKVVARSWVTVAVMAAIPALATIGLAVKAALESGGY